MKKRLFSLLTSLFMVISMIGVLPAVTASALTYGDYTYFLLSDGTVIITKYNGYATSLSIPSTIDNKKVTSIGRSAFEDRESLKSVTIPNGVTSIGNSAFCGCSSLTSITIPNSITSIESYAFYVCTSLKSVTIPNGVTSIGQYAFGFCYSLTSITIPNSVTSIGDDAFYSCKSLTSITIPNSVTSIDWCAFSDCTSLKSITIPNSVTSIEAFAFYNCTSLKDVYYIGTSTQWNNIAIDHSYNSNLFYANRHYCNHSYSYNITKEPTCTENGVKTYICSMCNDSYTEIIPATGHNYITTVVAPTCTQKGYKLHKCSVCGDEYKDTYTNATGHNYVATVVKPTCTEKGYKIHKCSVCGDEYIDTYTNATGHKYVATVVAPTCTEQGYTLHRCSVCGDEYIDTYTNATGHKYKVTATTKATLTKNGTKVETCSECGQKRTTTIYYPKTIILTGYTSFPYDATVHKPRVIVKDANGDTISSSNYKVTYSGNCKDAGKYSVVVEFIGNYSGKKTLNFEIYEPYNYTVENNTVKITGYYGSLKDITIPSTIEGKQVTSIGVNAFTSSNFTSVTIPNTVKKIEHFAFGGCIYLKSLKLGTGLTTIGNGAFKGCNNLTSVTIPDKVTSIGEEAFCSYKLKTVIIPKNVNHIGAKAFGYYYDTNNRFWKNYELKIYCYSGSLAERYAKSNGFDYQLLQSPATVTGFKTAATTANAIKVTCNKVAGATGYVFYRAVSGKWQRVGDSKTNTFTDTKLKSGTSYRYAVKAYKTANGKNYYSASYPTLWTSTNPATVSFTVAGGVKKAVLKWSKTNGATGYKVYYKTSAKGKWVGLTTTKSLTYTKTGLVKGKTYWFTVKAYRTANGTTYNSTFVTKSVKVK